MDELDTSEEGLSSEEAERRLEKYGENRLESDDDISPLSIFIDQFRDNLIYLLIGAAILSVAIGFFPGEDFEYTEAGIILVILLVNGIVGFIQNYRAEKAIKALKEMSSPSATVLRDGKKKEVDSTQVVPGDIVYLEQGDAVPADARLLEEDVLSTDESALTGESNSVSKSVEEVEDDTALADRDNMVFKNTHVVKGRGKAVIVETGMDTEVGEIAEQIQEADDEETPFQKEVDEMGRKIGYLVIGVVILTAFAQATLTGADWITIVLLAIGLAVAATPESLPVIVTATLAIGSKKMAKRDALVRSLPVVEALGSVNHIVTDKTGTLTEGVMTVEKIWFNNEEYTVTGTGLSTEGKFTRNGEEINPEELDPVLKTGLYCNNSEEKEGEEEGFRGEPTEIALLVSSRKAGMEQDLERERSIPFSSSRKRMTVVMEDGKAYSKGAPEVILDRCDHLLVDGEKKDLTEEKKQEILEKNDSFADDALRVLGFAQKEVDDPEADPDEIESGMTFVGLQGMMDPEREEVKGAIEDCRTAGIGVVMATGDNVKTAKAIGEKLGFKTEHAKTGSEVEEMTDKELQEAVEQTEIFARVSPEHKVRILEALQDLGYNVAMSGDGVNDAPALKDSDVGVAMGQRGTDVAKKSSDMVLQDDNFVTIRDAIAEGRHIFDNIRKVTNQLLSTNSGEVSFVFFGTILGGILFPEVFSGGEAVVLTTAMILWVNFASDGPPALALAEDPKVDNIMKRQPRGRDESIIDKKIIAMIAFTGPVAALTMLPLFMGQEMILGHSLENNFQLAQTMLFMALAMFEILVFVVIRRDYGLRFLDNRWLLGGIGFAILSHLLILYTPIAQFFGVTPLGLEHWMWVGAALGVWFVIEMSYRKALSYKLGDRQVHLENQ